MKNTFLNYLVKESGIKSCLIYRVIIDMYIFVIPILPSINSFLEGVLFMLYPYFLYELIEILMVKKLPKMSEYKKSKKKLNDSFLNLYFFIKYTVVSNNTIAVIIRLFSLKYTNDKRSKMFIISNKIVLFNCFIIYLYSLSYYAAAD